MKVDASSSADSSADSSAGSPASAGAQTAKHDVDYRPKGSIAYVRYEYRDANAVHEWKLAPELVSGGMKMKGGDLGGFAVHGVTVDWYGSSKYVCFRTK